MSSVSEHLSASNSGNHWISHCINTVTGNFWTSIQKCILYRSLWILTYMSKVCWYWPHTGHCHYTAVHDLQHTQHSPFHMYHLDNILQQTVSSVPNMCHRDEWMNECHLHCIWRKFEKCSKCAMPTVTDLVANVIKNDFSRAHMIMSILTRSIIFILSYVK